MVATVSTRSRMHELLQPALRLIAEEQVSTGEVVSYRTRENGSFEYCFSLPVSAYVADALAILDPLSQFFDAQALEQAGERFKMPAGREAIQIRRRVRRFLAWQQAADGTWRFHGSASGLDPDLETTASCAAVLTEGSGISSLDAARYVRGFARFPVRDGVLRRLTNSADYIGNLNAVRALALAGGDAEALASAISWHFQFTGARFDVRVAYVAARVWAQTRLGSLAVFKSAAEAFISSAQQADGGFGGPLSTVMGLSALLYLDGDNDRIDSAAAAVCRVLELPPSRRIEPLFAQQAASPALTTAIGIGALLRAAPMLRVGLA